MAQGRGNQKNDTGPERARDAEEPEGSGWMPDFQELARRALALGLSGFFSTEETLRRALGDTLPSDWTEFAVEQSDRARREFLERLSGELARSLENLDLAAVLRELMAGRSIEVRARIRLVEDGSEAGESPPRADRSGAESEG